MNKRAPALRIVRAPETLDADTRALERVARGETSALGEVYERHAAALLRFAARLVGSADAEDLVHATFVTAARVANTYDGRGADARAWLFGILVRHERQRKRSFARFTRFLTRAQSSGVYEPRDEERSDIARGLRSLSEAKRTVLLLAEVEGYACEEIAKMLDIPVGTVWTRLHHARRELRAFYDRTS